MDNSYKNLPDEPGVYLFRDGGGHILYVGKAGNLRRRVSSYFMRAHDTRIETLVGKIKKIDHRKTDTALEALILEAELIRKYSPPFNVRERDDKSFLYVEITKEKFPRVLLVRGREVSLRLVRVSQRRSSMVRLLRRQASARRYESCGGFFRGALMPMRAIRNYGLHPNLQIKIRSIRINLLLRVG